MSYKSNQNPNLLVFTVLKQYLSTLVTLSLDNASLRILKVQKATSLPQSWQAPPVRRLPIGISVSYYQKATLRQLSIILTP